MFPESDAYGICLRGDKPTMSEIADRYRRLSGDFADRVAKVSPERWGASSPCEGWTARDVVAHMVEGAIDRFVCFDLAIHGWDLARATGLDETIALADVGPDADDQTKLLALFGRHV